MVWVGYRQSWESYSSNKTVFHTGAVFVLRLYEIFFLQLIFDKAKEVIRTFPCSVFPVLDRAEGDPEVIAEFLLAHAGGSAERLNSFFHFDIPFCISLEAGFDINGHDLHEQKFQRVTKQGVSRPCHWAIYMSRNFKGLPNVNKLAILSRHLHE